jgi:type I restriction enzyme S subunit
MSEIIEGYKESKFGVVPIEWDIEKIKNIVKICTGRRDTKNKVDKGDYPFFVRSQNIERINTYSFDGEAILTAGDGVGVGKVFHYVNGKFDFHQRVYKLSDFDRKKVNGKYLFEFFSKNFIKEVTKYTAKTSVDSVRLEMISEMEILLPTIKEQEKISEILSTCDSTIEKQEQLIEKKKELKKGLMQVLYSQGTKKEVRIKTKLGEIPTSWKVIKAKEVFDSVSIKNNEDEELLSVTQDRGTIPRTLLEGSVVMPEGSTNGYKLVVPNNFIISLRSFQGGLEISKYRGIISPAYTVLDNKINICHDYFKYYFKKEEFISRLNGIIVGIRDGKQISYTDFGEMYLPIPSIEEQNKIAEILMLADKEIGLLKKELEAFKLQKKGLMQRLLTGEVRVKVN